MYVKIYIFNNSLCCIITDILFSHKAKNIHKNKIILLVWKQIIFKCFVYLKTFDIKQNVFIPKT